MSMTNNELESILPSVHTMLQALDDKNFTDYQAKLDKATGKAVDALEGIIDDGSLALDPEQLVRAVEVLTKSKVAIFESKRKLLDTCIKGEVMIKALEKDNEKKGGKESSVLLEYLEKNNLNTDIDKTGTSSVSVFETIAENEEK